MIFADFTLPNKTVEYDAQIRKYFWPKHANLEGTVLLAWLPSAVQHIKSILMIFQLSIQTLTYKSTEAIKTLAGKASRSD